MIKALFFDIDGTLVSFNTHRIPQSAITAITKAKDAGIGIYISTGRPYSLINNIGEIRHLIDGYITTNGACSFIGDTIVACNPIPADDVATVIRCADSMGFACMVVGERDWAMLNGDGDNGSVVANIFNHLLNVPDLRGTASLDDVLKQRILQLTPVISPGQEQSLMAMLNGCISSRWCPDFADITALNADKGNGLLAVAAHQGIKIEETMAFGDGGNDISIVKVAGTGIAMGNANPPLKAVADYVTTSVDDGGIYKALKHFGVI